MKSRPSIFCPVLLAIPLLVCCKKETARQPAGNTISAAPAEVKNGSPEAEAMIARVRKIRTIPTAQRIGMSELDEFERACGNLTVDQLREILDQTDLAGDFDSILIPVFAELARRKPEAYFHYLEKLAVDNSLGWGPFGRKLTDVAVRADRGAAERWVTGVDMPNRGAFLRVLETVSALHPDDHERQIGLILSREDQDPKLLGQVFMDAGKVDPEDAMKTASSRLTGEALEQAQYSVIFGASFVDPESAYRIAESIDPGVSTRWYGLIAQQWLKQDTDAMVNALGSMTPEKITSVLSMQKNVEGLVADHPDALIAATSKLVFSESNKPLFRNVILASAGRDFDSTLAWVQGFPDSPSKAEFLQVLEHIKNQTGE